MLSRISKRTGPYSIIQSPRNIRTWWKVMLKSLSKSRFAKNSSTMLSRRPETISACSKLPTTSKNGLLNPSNMISFRLKKIIRTFMTISDKWVSTSANLTLSKKRSSLILGFCSSRVTASRILNTCWIKPYILLIGSLSKNRISINLVWYSKEEVVNWEWRRQRQWLLQLQKKERRKRRHQVHSIRTMI